MRATQPLAPAVQVEIAPALVAREPGVDPGLALRDAKRHVRARRPEWAAPFHWAPFILTGG